MRSVSTQANVPNTLQRNWPKNFYSALAGFVEPGESHEDTVERELWEEAGVKVLGLKYHSTQPWVSPTPMRFALILMFSVSPSRQM